MKAFTLIMFCLLFIQLLAQDNLKFDKDLVISGLPSNIIGSPAIITGQGSQAILVYRISTDNHIYWATTSDGQVFNQKGSFQGISSTQDVDIIAYNNVLYLAWIPSGTSNLQLARLNNGVVSQQWSVPGASPGYPPTLTIIGAVPQLSVIYSESSQNGQFFQSKFQNGNWGPPASLTGNDDESRGQVSMAWVIDPNNPVFDKYTILDFRGADSGNTLYFMGFYQGQWGEPAPAGDQSNGHIDATWNRASISFWPTSTAPHYDYSFYVENGSKQLYYKYWEADAYNTWSNGQIILSNSGQQITPNSSPTSFVDSSNSIFVYWVNNGNLNGGAINNF